MAGASLNAHWYNHNINTAIFLAPPASLKNNDISIFKFMSTPLNQKLLTTAAEGLGLYNILPWNYLNSGVAGAFCKAIPSVCNDLVSMFADEDPTIDYTERYDVYMSNMPAGASYRNLLHYGQLVNQDQETFQRFDWGSDENMKRYNQTTPPHYDMSKISFKIGIFSGSQDLLADPKDVAWTHKQLEKATVFSHEYYLGHNSFAIAKDMSFFTVDAVTLLNLHNGKKDETCAAEFDSTKVQARHDHCSKVDKDARFLTG